VIRAAQLHRPISRSDGSAKGGYPSIGERASRREERGPLRVALGLEVEVE
jgi:hypothetical protein